MHLDRTRFKKDIVAEYLPAVDLDSHSLIILLDGVPSVPSKKTVMEYWAKQGYWVFHPRYRGSWESGGKFLQQSPEIDVIDVINEIKKGFKSIRFGKKIIFKPKQIVLMGSSFGGTAGIMASRDKQVNKVVAMSPVVDWLDDHTIEPLDTFKIYTQKAFGNGYRFSTRDWNQLKTGKFFNPVNVVNEIDGKKLLILHCQDDPIVNWKRVRDFSKRVDANLKFSKKGGHLGFSNSLQDKKLLRVINKFLNR